jgi:hypothetical protein
MNNLNIEFKTLESARDVDSAQAATETSHKDWLNIQSGDVNIQKSLSSLFSSARAQREKLKNGFRNYYKQGEGRPDPDFLDLAYRSAVHQQRKSQEQFLNSIPDRIQVKPVPFVWVLIDWEAQEHGTTYCSAVRDVGVVMESFANYIRYA